MSYLEQDFLIEKLKPHIKGLMKELSEIYPTFKLDDPHNVETPRRISKMLLEQFRGLRGMDFDFTTFPNEGQRGMWVVKKDIEFSSLCAHHWMPFMGKVHIAYLPAEKICGISKLDRTVNYFSKRPQVQEQLGDNILEFLVEKLDIEKIVVVIESLHTCVACRGIESRNSTMMTIHSKGIDGTSLQAMVSLLRSD